MRRLLFFIALLLLLAAPAKADDNNWQISSFASDIKVQPDGRIAVAETIVADFRASPHHGIYRDLPVTYRNDDNTTRYTEVQISGVTNNAGSPVPYTIENNSANLRVKIGDPNRTLIGLNTYILSYTVAGIINSFEKYDEIYWNATGLDWTVPIVRAEATVILPQPAVVQYACYYGVSGSTAACDAKLLSQSQVRFSAPGALLPGQGLTVAVGFTKGLVPILTPEDPAWSDQLFPFYGAIILFGLVFLGGVAVSLAWWWQHGRDFWFGGKTADPSSQPERIKPVGAYEAQVPEYDPPAKLRPAEISVLLSESVTTRDLSASIVDLAVRGYLTITEIPKKYFFSEADYTLERTGQEAAALLLYEQKLLSSLFKSGASVQVSSLKNTFYRAISAIELELYKDVTRKKIFVANPERVRSRYQMFSWLGLIGGWAIGGLGAKIGNSYVVAFGAALAGVGIVGVFIARAMPRRTAYGRELYRQALGYREFVTKVEKYRAPFYERENLLMDTLPYAIVFGVAKKFAQATAGMGLQTKTPAWYHGTAPFNAAIFSSNIASFSKSLSTTMASSPSSSGSGGGGSSGGGGGGGGGGGW